MDLTTTKANVRSVFEEGFGQGDLGVIDAALAPGATDRHEFAPDEPDFQSHLKGAITMFRTAMPDLAASVEDLIAEGSTVAVRVRMTGTHTGGELFGVPAGGRSVDIEQFHFIACDEQGRGTHHWANVGAAELMRQIAPGQGISVPS
jgi:predicted ester cyclase